MVKISILTVTYNAAATLEKTILSVIGQSYPEIEYIIVDGKSTDATMEIVGKYGNRISKVLSEPDKGIYDAINKGLSMATGDYLLVLGADDCLKDSDVIEKVVRHMDDPDAVYYGNVYRTVRKDIYCGRYSSYKLAVKNISHQALFYPRNVYSSKQYNIEYRLFADWAYNIELWKSNRFEYVPVLVADYFDDGSSNTQDDDRFFGSYKKLVCDNLGWVQYYYAAMYHYFRYMVKGDK